MRLKKIFLNRKKIEFLLKNIENKELSDKLSYALNKERVYENGYPTGRYRINMSDHELESMLDELTYLLTSIGLDENDEVNADGMIIENIIDEVISYKYER